MFESIFSKCDLFCLSHWKEPYSILCLSFLLMGWRILFFRGDIQSLETTVRWLVFITELSSLFTPLGFIPCSLVHASVSKVSRVYALGSWASLENFPIPEKIYFSYWVRNWGNKLKMCGVIYWDCPVWTPFIIVTPNFCLLSLEHFSLKKNQIGS